MPVNPRNLAKALKKVGAKGSVRANKKKIVKSRAGKNTKGPADGGRAQKHQGKKKKFVKIHDRAAGKKLKNRPRQTRKANRLGRV